MQRLSTYNLPPLRSSKVGWDMSLNRMFKCLARTLIVNYTIIVYCVAYTTLSMPIWKELKHKMKWKLRIIFLLLFSMFWFEIKFSIQLINRINNNVDKINSNTWFSSFQLLIGWFIILIFDWLSKMKISCTKMENLY